MKKSLMIAAAAFICVVAAQAQLKVDSLGNVAIGTTNGLFNPKLSVGDFSQGSSSWTNMGIVAKIEAQQSNKNIAIRGYTVSPASTGSNFGVLGSAQVSGYHGRNYGVCGMISFDQSSQFYGGAGIYALDNPYTFSMSLNNLQGLYAAYFVGSTNLHGQTIAQEIYTPADSRLSEDVETVETVETRSDSDSQTLDNLLKMNVLEFNMKNTHKLKSPEEQEAEEITDETREAYEYAKKKDDAVYSRRHYGLSAEQLQKIYPNLVLEGQDGYLYVNYTEMVPLLIRSIQELKQELDELKGSDGSIKKMPQSSGVGSFGMNGKSVLYQNTPNPFKEKTVIRFTLGDDAKDASICIFDMSGKLLKKLPVSQGMECVSVNGYELGEGMFLYSLVVNGQEIDTKRMILSQ